jgi:hypothetical protein
MIVFGEAPTLARGSSQQCFNSLNWERIHLPQLTAAQELQIKAQKRLASLMEEKLVTRISVLSTLLGGGKTTERLLVRISIETHKTSPDFDQTAADKAKNRIKLTLLSGAAAAWPFASRAQQPERMRRVGMLTPLPADDPEVQRRHTAFLQGLQQLGWTDGRNIRIDARWSGGNASLTRKYAEELADVATTYVGKCVIVAVALTIMERSLLPDRPTCLFDAGRRGSGKGTCPTCSYFVGALLGS